jgi:hypothetical protein
MLSEAAMANNLYLQYVISYIFRLNNIIYKTTTALILIILLDSSQLVMLEF